ncbi:hypothetical protein [Xylophilus sp. ASV27]|uniref:hypothetical protein n=1 Tax=Xylophilus sp. ASV27 TaxID=2795129 RepID=UPI0018ED5222|nr:hypothetical protein [Xylophilus sp. ASV27]
MPAVISVFFYQYKKRNYTRTEVAGNYVAAAEAPKWSFDEIRLKDGRYEIAGWITDEPRNGFWLKPRIVLVPLHQNKAIEIRTRMVLRKDISAKMGIAEGLNFMGFRAVIRKKYIPVEDGARIMISVERNGKRVLVDTGRSLPVDV